MIAGTGSYEKGNYHLYFVRAKKCKVNKNLKRKTPIYIVRKDSSCSMAERLGLIKWYGAFRQFVFYPDEETCWSKSCLELINNFLDKVNRRHRNKLKKQRRG